MALFLWSTASPTTPGKRHQSQVRALRPQALHGPRPRPILSARPTSAVNLTPTTSMRSDRRVIVMPEQNATHKYIAFTCYGRKDSKAAARREKRLQWFRSLLELAPEDPCRQFHLPPLPPRLGCWAKQSQMLGHSTFCQTTTQIAPVLTNKMATPTTSLVVNQIQGPAKQESTVISAPLTALMKRPRKRVDGAEGGTVVPGISPHCPVVPKALERMSTLLRSSSILSPPTS